MILRMAFLCRALYAVETSGESSASVAAGFDRLARLARRVALR
jgi:hypothetical protein